MIGAVTEVYNDEALIGAVIKCFKPFVDKHIVLISETPWFGEPEPPDRTEEVCRSLGVDVVKGNWRQDHIQRNRGIELCSDCDLIFSIDSDELMEAKEIEKLLKFAENPNYRAIGVIPEGYWRDIDHVLRPKSTYEPIILMRPEVRFVHNRNINCSYVVCDAEMHHLVWCGINEVRRKSTTWGHRDLYTKEHGEKWYQEHFLNWKEGDRAIDLLGNEFGVERKPLPKELREKLGVE